MKSKSSRLIEQGFFVDGTNTHYRRKHKDGIVHNDWRVGKEKYKVDKSSHFFHNDFVWYMDDPSEQSGEFGTNKLALSFDGDFNDFVENEYTDYTEY